MFAWKEVKETTHNQQYSCIIVVFLQDGSCNRSETQKLSRLENIFIYFRYIYTNAFDELLINNATK